MRCQALLCVTSNAAYDRKNDKGRASGAAFVSIQNKTDYLLAEQPLIGLAAVASLHLFALAMVPDVPVLGGVMMVPVPEPANAGAEASMVPIANAPIIESPRIAPSSPAETRLTPIMVTSDGQYAARFGRSGLRLLTALQVPP